MKKYKCNKCGEIVYDDNPSGCTGNGNSQGCDGGEWVEIEEIEYPKDDRHNDLYYQSSWMIIGKQ